MTDTRTEFINKVAFNVNQRNDPRYTDAMRKQARKNIGFWYNRRQTLNHMPDFCSDTVEVPNASTTHLVYYPYLDAKQVTLTNGWEYHLSLFSTPILLQDPSETEFSYRVYTAGPEEWEQTIYLTPWIRRQAGSEINCTIDWLAEGIPEALVLESLEDAIHFAFSKPLKDGSTVTLSVAGTESNFINASEV